jgi:nucleoside 2-deoxyribosyltransferase
MERMMQRYVYLAGPIVGRTKSEANHWRQHVADQLGDHGIVGISPLRCEPIHGERYPTSHDADPLFGTPRAIGAKNRFDVKAADIVLAYMPEEHPLSLGTLGEIFWADAYGKQVIMVTTDHKLLEHPVLDAAVDWKLSTLDEAIDVCIGILGGYNGGKNV